MKYYTLFVAFLFMVLSVNSTAIDDETRTACAGSSASTFLQCIDQYGGWQPEQTICQNKANQGEEFNHCLAQNYHYILDCFKFCPNHPRKATYDQFNQQYISYYTPIDSPTNNPTDTNNPTGTGTGAGASASPNFDLETGSGSSKITVFSISTILCMIAYLLF